MKLGDTVIYWPSADEPYQVDNVWKYRTEPRVALILQVSVFDDGLLVLKVFPPVGDDYRVTAKVGQGASTPGCWTHR